MLVVLCMGDFVNGTSCKECLVSAPDATAVPRINFLNPFAIDTMRVVSLMIIIASEIDSNVHPRPKRGEPQSSSETPAEPQTAVNGSVANNKDLTVQDLTSQ